MRFWLSKVESGKWSPSIRSPRVQNPRSPLRSSQCARSLFVMTRKFKRLLSKSVSARPIPIIPQTNNAQQMEVSSPIRYSPMVGRLVMMTDSPNTSAFSRLFSLHAYQSTTISTHTLLSIFVLSVTFLHAIFDSECILGFCSSR
jgi:hypothetical protein